MNWHNFFVKVTKMININTSKTEKEKINEILSNWIDFTDKRHDDSIRNPDLGVIYAAEENEWPIVETFLKLGGNVNTTDGNGNTVLHWAAIHNNPEMAEIAIDWSVDSTINNKDIKTALSIAEENNYKDVISVIKSDGFYKEKKKKEQDTKDNIFEIVKNGNLENIDKIFNNIIDLEIYNEDFFTPLGIAAISDKKEIVEYLLKNGAKDDIRNLNGTTSLMIYSACGMVDKIKDILQHDIKDIDNINSDMHSALTYALKNNHYDIADYLIEKGVKLNYENYSYNNIIFKIISLGDTKALEYLINKGIDINKVDYLGNSCLQNSIEYDKENIALKLIEKGADINFYNKNMLRSTLVTAVESGTPVIVKELINHGIGVNPDKNNGLNLLMIYSAIGELEKVKELVGSGEDVESVDDDGTSPLMKAVSKKNTQCVEYLLQKGANPNRINNNGCNSINSSCINSDMETLKLLVKYGGNVNIESNNTTPLIVAARSPGDIKIIYDAITEESYDEFMKIINFLLDNKADINKQTDQGYTAFMIAAIYNDLKRMLFLLDKGADLSLRNKDGETAVDILIKNNKKETIKILREKGFI